MTTERVVSGYAVPGLEPSHIPKDPLRFIQELSKYHSVVWREGYAKGVQGNMFLHYEAKMEKAEEGIENQRYISWILFGQDPSTTATDFFDNDFDDLPKRVREFARGSAAINGISIDDFDLRKNSLSDLGRWSKYIGTSLFFSNCKQDSETRRLLLEDSVIAEVGMDEDSRYQVKWFDIDNRSTNELDEKGFEEKFCGIPTNNYWSVFHRMIELFAGVPKRKWHNPQTYIDISRMEGYETEVDNQTTETDAVVDTTLDLLFSGEEREKLEAQIAEARLKMRQGWASVPIMNLGTIVLPTPGRQDISQDEFVVSGAMYLVEYLQQLGVMNQEEAEDMMAQKLTNYFVHRTGFQLSRDRAGEIVDQLRQTVVASQEK